MGFPFSIYELWRMVEIKDISGKTRFSTPINKGAKGKFTLMKEDYIILPFSVSEPVYFKLGDYVDLSGVLDDSLGGLMSKRYEIVDLQTPTFNSSTGGYDYKLRLDAYYWKWKNKIFKYTPEHAGYEASWSLTATLDVQLGVFLRNLKALGYKFNGKDFEFSIDFTVENKAVAMTYDNMNLLDALFSMAGEDKWNCDCWITDNVIHFGRNEYGDSVKLELGVEVSSMTRSESKGTFATRIYAFGSTKNIPENYRPIEEQAVINGVVQKRLMLPADTPYIDVYPDMSEEEAVEDIKVFDEVYPRRVGTLSDVKTVDRALTGEDGEQVGTFKAYQYKDTGLNFKKEYIIEGRELEITFQSGKLNGLKFGAIFEPEGTSSGSQIWEIEANEDYGRLLPDDTLYPENGDEYILTGFNIQLVSDQYIPAAEQELKEKAEKYAEQRKKDDGTYNTTLHSKWVYEDKLKRFFEFGQKVNLINKAFFENGRESRILGWEFNLDIPWDSPTYIIGESMPYSRINDLEEKLETLTYKGQTYIGSGGGSGIYIIRTNDSTAPSDSNVFSARRSLATLLRKDAPDTTEHLLKLLGGIISPFLESPDFVTGPMGAGFTIKQNADGQSYAEVDKLLVRMKAVFQTLEIMKTELAGASFMFNASGARATITKVEYIDRWDFFYSDGKAKYYSDGKRAYVQPGKYGAVYRCYFLTDDGEEAIENRFRVGNLVRSQTFNIKAGVHENVSNRYWWRRVENVGENWIDVSATNCDAGSDIPQIDDVIVQLGDDTDPDYQSAIVLSAYGDGAPYLTMYQGINSFSLSGKDVFTIGYDRVNRECYLKNYGRAYIGNREETNYLRLVSDGLEVRAKRFLFSNGEDIETRIEATERNITLKLGETGIDIEHKQIKVIADRFLVQDENGTGIAVFKVVDGKPLLKAENIDVDNLVVKHLDGADGTFSGELVAAKGTIGAVNIKDGSYEYGIYYKGDNSELSMRPGMFMGIPYDVFLHDLSAQSNILLYLKRRRNNHYDRALYVDGTAEVYGRLGVGRGPNTGFNAYLPALVTEGIGNYGQFSLNTYLKNDNVNMTLPVHESASFIYNVTGDIATTITVPTENLSDGQIIFIRNIGSKQVKISGKILAPGDYNKVPSNAIQFEITPGKLCIMIYCSQLGYWIANLMT